MFNDMLNPLGFKFDGDGDYYWPSVSYGNLKYLPNVENELKKALHGYDGYVIISNGHVNSLQAENFDFVPVIKKLCNTYPKTLFIETHKTGLEFDSLIFSGEITKDVVEGIDVNYLSYIALKSKLVVGRSSGPFTCCITRSFMSDFNRKAVTFVSHKNAAYFVDNYHVPNAKLMYLTDISDPAYHIMRILDE
jgi:hypothetical protein